MEQRWDAGEIGCGRLAIELKRRLDQLQPGEQIRVIARDPGAASDLPAWCRMTGNELVSAAPPEYVIRRKSGEA